MNLLDIFQNKVGKKPRKKGFTLNNKAYTITMKTMNIRELFSLLTTTEGQLFGVLLHKLYENNRDIIIDEGFKTYIFSEMDWNFESKSRKDQFTKLLRSLDAKDVLTRVQADRVVVNPFVTMVGGTDSFISSTMKYYTDIRASRGIHSTTAEGYVYEQFERNYELEIKAIIEELNNE